MFKGLENQKKLCHFLEQVLIAVQIAAIFLIFITSLYWFLELIGNSFLSFMEPVISFIKEMMRAQFAEELEKGQAGIDGSLFIFIALIGVLLYVISQVKIFLKYSQTALDKAIVQKKEEFEIQFNKELKEEAKRKILAYNNIVILINIALKNLVKDMYLAKNDVKTIDKKQEDIVLVALYNSIKTIPGCKFSKDGRTLIITSRRFDGVDGILLSIDNALTNLKAQLRARKLALSYHIAIDAFPDNVLLKDIYADLKSLISLNMPDEILCYGNFCNRYEYVKVPKYEAFLKGTYEITEEENIWSLVKKG